MMMIIIISSSSSSSSMIGIRIRIISSSFARQVKGRKSTDPEEASWLRPEDLEHFQVRPSPPPRAAMTIAITAAIATIAINISLSLSIYIYIYITVLFLLLHSLLPRRELQAGADPMIVYYIIAYSLLWYSQYTAHVVHYSIVCYIIA